MSTSPCCAEYKFPASSPNGDIGCFKFGSKLLKQADGYFALKSPLSMLQRPVSLPPKQPRAKNNFASGSVSSFALETTWIDNSLLLSHDFNRSADTLFENCAVDDDVETMPRLLPVSVPVALSATVSVPSGQAHLSDSQRNVLLHSLRLPKRGTHHKALSCVASSLELLSRDANIEEAQPSSAVEPRFHLDRKFSLGIAEETVSREEGHQQTIPVPALRKRVTLPTSSEVSFLDTIKTQQMRRSLFLPRQENFRDSIMTLSLTISYLSPDAIVEVIRQSVVHPETGLRDVLVLDIRPLADHVKSHIAGSINICLPLTLLKRPSFDFKRCVVSLPAYEKIILQNYFHHSSINFEKQLVCSNSHSGARGFPAIILYDHSNTSSSIFHMCRKLVDHSCFYVSSAPPIYLIDAPFQTLADAHPEVLALRKTEDIDITKLLIQNPRDGSKSLVSSNTGQVSLSHASAPSSIQTLSTNVSVLSSPDVSALSTPDVSALSTPNVSNFSLPLNLPETKFKIRHNEEVFDLSTAPSNDDKLSRLNVTSTGLKLLPQWLKDSVANNTQIRADFNRLEECEKIRLNNALKMKSDYEFLTPGGRKEETPVINSGLDFGHKNRYKDIFLYEHSRVSLSDFSSRQKEVSGDELKQLGCNYINASYLKASKSVLGTILGAESSNTDLSRHSNYIATQGPLLRTAGDFWKCVALQASLVIISLTSDFENGVEKCFPFWKSGSYMSGNNVVGVNLIDTEQFGALKLRSFAINVDKKVHHKVLQVHLDSWSDMGVTVNPDDVLAMIHLKNHVFGHVQELPEYPTVIHCSAGCGRTGVFAAADMLMNAFRVRGDDYEVTADPVYDVVNDLRRQRILMVQTVRQYCSIYSLLIHRIVGPNEWQSIGDTEITRAFLGL